MLPRRRARAKEYARGHSSAWRRSSSGHSMRLPRHPSSPPAAGLKWRLTTRAARASRLRSSERRAASPPNGQKKRGRPCGAPSFEIPLSRGWGPVSPPRRSVRPLRASTTDLPVVVASSDTANFLSCVAIRAAVSLPRMPRDFPATASRTCVACGPRAFFARSLRSQPLFRSRATDPPRLSAERAKTTAARSDVSFHPTEWFRTFRVRVPGRALASPHPPPSQSEKHYLPVKAASAVRSRRLESVEDPNHEGWASHVRFRY